VVRGDEQRVELHGEAELRLRLGELLVRERVLASAVVLDGLLRVAVVGGSDRRRGEDECGQSGEREFRDPCLETCDRKTRTFG
jgi:hypothetical protein